MFVLKLTGIQIYIIEKTILHETNILLVPEKYEITFSTIDLHIFQYCDSNIELFSMVPYLVLVLPTLR